MSDPEHELIGTMQTQMRGGVEYRGSVVKVFFHPTYKVMVAKVQYFNEPGSYFYREVDRCTSA